MANLLSGRGSIKAPRLRVARLSATGTTPSGPSNMYVTSSLVKLTVDPEKLTGTDISRQNAAGDYCIDVRDPDRTRWLNLQLELCEPDPELIELLVEGFSLYTEGADTIGFQYPDLGVAPDTDYGVSLELWTWNVNAGARDGTYPYLVWALPKTLNWSLGARNFENAPMDNILTGRAIENANWGNGPNNDWKSPAGVALDSTQVLQARLGSVIPAAVSGYQSTPLQV